MSEPLAHFDLVTQSWRTYQVSLLASLDGSSTESFRTWPKSGMWDATTFSQLPSAARPTVENESGSSAGLAWPTPEASVHETPKVMRMTPSGQYRGMSNQGIEGTIGLARTAAAWTTPTVDDANNVTRASGAMMSLSRDTTAWATPTTRDHKDTGDLSNSMVRQDGTPRDDTVPRQAFAFDSPTGPTPSPTEGLMAPSDSSPPEPWQTPSGFQGKKRRQVGQMERNELLLPGEAEAMDGAKKKSRGLNPRFALWLMGFPTTWLDATPPKKQRKAK